VRDILNQRPDLGVIPKQCAELRTAVETMREGVAGASSLTNAELRLLPLLSTHLSFREIGERLFVTAHGENAGNVGLPEARRLIAQRSDHAHAGNRAALALRLQIAQRR
jgi:hypothetical protein